MASKYPCKRGSHKQLKKSLKPPFQFALQMNEATTLVASFLSSRQMPGYQSKKRNRMAERTNTHKFSDLNSFNWKNAGEKFIGESGLVHVFKYVYIPF